VVARVGLGPGVELRQVSTAAAGATDVMPDGARLDPSVFVRAAARLEVRLSRAVDLFAVAACDARVVNRRYTVDRDGVTQGVFTPDVLRPSLVIGLDARLGATEAPP
jgi:hypothetical protein